MQGIVEYSVKIRHCSGCSTDDARYCGYQRRNSTAEVRLGVSFSGVNSAVSVASLIGSPSPLTASTVSGSDLLITGTVQDSISSGIRVMMVADVIASIATISFPTTDSVVLTVTDIFGKPISCPGAKAPRGQYVTLSCTSFQFGTVVVSGSVL